jgi:hypothetical protein
MCEPSELGLDHAYDGEDGSADSAAIVASANPLERGAEGLLVVGKLSLARGGAIEYLVHWSEPSICPRFGGAFFWCADLLLSPVIEARTVCGPTRVLAVR